MGGTGCLKEARTKKVGQGVVVSKEDETMSAELRESMNQKQELK